MLKSHAGDPEQNLEVTYRVLKDCLAQTKKDLLEMKRQRDRTAKHALTITKKMHYYQQKTKTLHSLIGKVSAETD